MLNLYRVPFLRRVNLLHKERSIENIEMQSGFLEQ